MGATSLQAKPDRKINTEARERGFGYETHDPVTVTHELKTVALQQALTEHKWDALITGIRRDEDPTRAKDVTFRRVTQSLNGIAAINPEFWGQFATTGGKVSTSASNRCWIDGGDIWRYLAGRFRFQNVFRARRSTLCSLGCRPITHPIKNAATIEEIIAELETTRTSERAGRRKTITNVMQCGSSRSRFPMSGNNSG
jgi:sulfate adenylyltransferase subunit 2